MCGVVIREGMQIDERQESYSMPSIPGISPLVQSTVNGTNVAINGNNFTVPAGGSSPAVINLVNGQPASNALQPTTAGQAQAAAVPGNLDTSAVVQVVKLMFDMINQVIGGSGAAGAAGSVLGATGCPSCGPGCPGCGVANGAVQGPGITTPLQGASTAPASNVAQLSGVNDQNLQNSLNLIATDPEGQKLLAEAQKRGVTIKVANTGDRNVLGAFDPRTNSITIGNGNNIKTIVHELVHATTSQDGNSQTEEGLANVVGKRVESRLRGIPLEDPTTTFNNTLPNYTNLNRNNNIRQSLSNLGIVA